MIRAAQPADEQAVLSIASATGLFQSEELEELHAMFTAYLNQELGPEHQWIVYEEEALLTATAYFAPESFTLGVWNMYFIAVHPTQQSRGIGRTLVLYIEQLLREQSQRLLLIETSGLPNLQGARSFYASLGYQQEACLRDFYDVGDDKIIFRKAL